MVDNVCLMASHGYPHRLVLQQEQNMGIIKDFQPFLPNYGAKQEITKLGSLKMMPQQCEEPWRAISGFSESNWFAKTASDIERPAFTDVQDVHRDSVLFSSGIAEHFLRHEKMAQFLMSRESEVERGGLDITSLYDLMGLNEMHQKPLIPSLIYPSSESNTKPLLDFVGGLASSSKITFQPDGRVFFTGTGTEMKHLLSVVAEFYSLKTSANLGKHSVLVPYFDRFQFREKVNIDGSPLKMHGTTVAPLKSPEKFKTRGMPKEKNGKKLGRDRDLYTRNYFHACESLLSLMIDRKKNGKSAIHSLQKSGTELPQLLTQFSASIAGTGLAVLFSVVCKVACARVPFCSYKLLNTGVGFGLVWLSWSVNKLRDTIVPISKNPRKSDLKEEEILMRVETSVNEIYFRAAALMAVAVLRFA
ncbi:hypothetical protein RchiOBHm_Chr6g0291821 [Rosa chinensis]|uniref:Uncharacterized protein n=1 Tax=Rosa chinensis TaxID=74649 RepID=A0A2P6PW97_ROSCH|nr:uncharacterized protein LOC112171567 [Rosa chinensis]PRQ26184.1 hypothetical protein RchiOBHm_Chr6g0291821 [Rosa chinensis]